MNSNPSELLPCPFCGAKTTYGNFGEALCRHDKDCWIAGLRGHDNSNMLAKWNTRHSPTPPLPEGRTVTIAESFVDDLKPEFNTPLPDDLAKAVEVFQKFVSTKRRLPGIVGQVIGCESYRLDFSGFQEGEVYDAIQAAAKLSQDLAQRVREMEGQTGCCSKCGFKAWSNEENNISHCLYCSLQQLSREKDELIERLVEALEMEETKHPFMFVAMNKALSLAHAKGYGKK